MPYRLKHGESVAENVRRIVREESASAVEHMRIGEPGKLDEAVHEVRKSIKKTRAVLRLVRPELGKTFDEENIRLRDAGQRLSPLRDAGAVIEAFDQLRAEKHLAAGSAAPIRRYLAVQKKRLADEAAAQKVLEGLTAVFGELRKSVKRWPEIKGFHAIEPGLEETFRKGRKALAVARKTGARDDFHEWRKRVKDHWYHVRLLEKLWTDVLEGYEQSLEKVEDALGEDLNLAVLRERLLGNGTAAANGAGLDRVIEAIDESRSELRKRALEIGERVYAENPKHLTRRMGRLWKAWR